MGTSIVNVSSETWEAEVVQSARLVLVDFWGPTCGPCIALMPTLEAFAREYADQVKVVKVNCDDNRDLARSFGVRGIPYLVLLQSGATVAVVSGRTRTRIAAEVETFLA